MELSVNLKQFRRLLDLAYIGNWVLNSAQGEDRIKEYDEVESLLFSKCRDVGMEALAERFEGSYVPSKAFVEGGIHDAIMAYEDNIFFEILAEELARRDIINEGGAEDDADQINERMVAYIAEFERNGTDNIVLEL
jgi:hypothetical protein